MPEVTRTKPNALKDIARRLSELDGYEIKGGWGPSAIYENGMHVAQIMAQNEFGNASIGIPARPFARPAVREDKGKWDSTFAKLSDRYLNGFETAEGIMDVLGLMIENSLVEAIVRVESPPLSPVTLQLRKFKKDGRKITGATVGEAARMVADGTANYAGVSTKPLNDSGHAIATVTHTAEKI